MLADDEATARIAYDAVAGEYARTFPDLSAETAEDRMIIDRFARAVPTGGLVVDAGCGAGRIAAYLGQHGLRAVGIDISEGMLAEARVRNPTLPLVTGSLARLPVASGTAAGLIAWYSIIHTAPDDLAHVILELSRVLQAGAPVVVAFQCGSGERVVRTTAFGRDVRRINYRHRVDQVTHLLGCHGVTVLNVVTRDPAAAFETTPQAFVIGARATTT